MRKSFTRLFGVFMLFCMMSLQVFAVTNFGYSLSPVDGACQVPRQGGDFVITMNTDVKAVYNGTISLNNPNGTEYIPIQLRPEYESASGSGVFSSTSTMPSGVVTWKVTFSGKKVTINFGYDMGEFSEYYITVSENAIQNLAGVRFSGLAQGTGALQKCFNDASYAWDFTTADVTPPTPVWTGGSPATNPTDEQINVNPALGTFTLRFSEDIFWKAGATPLKVGDIALYRASDVGVYGGDVVYPLCSLATISGNVLTIQWPLPGTLPSLAKLYVRIKPGIIVDGRGLAFTGFNTNGEPYGTNPRVGWNFSTKDGTAPVPAFAMVGSPNNCGTNSDFTITLNEANIVIDTTRAQLTNSNIDAFVEFSGGAFDATITAPAVNPTVITINPTGTLTSGGTYTVGLKAGLWDSGDNQILPKTSQVFTAGDYTAPSAPVVWGTKNPNGTSFNVNIRVDNEPATTVTTYYYIVVKQDDVKNGAALDAYAPQKIDSILKIVNYNIAPAYGKDTVYWYKSGSVNKKIPVWASGKIYAPANTEILDHITMLDPSHGTDYVVYMFGADASNCSSNSLGLSIPTTGLYAKSTSNVTGLLSMRPSTYDILPPVVNFTAAKVDAADVYDGCSELPGTDTNSTDIGDGIKRNGPIYINFNEAVENVNGLRLTPAYIAASVTMTDDDGGTYYAKTTGADSSYYDAANKRIVIKPTVAFASGVTVTVTLLANTIQDAQDELRFGPNGTELLNIQTDDFCIEKYVGPIVVIDPCTGSDGHGRADGIVVSIDQYIYAPSYDGSGLLSNDPLSPSYVGKYVQIRQHDAEPTSPSLRDAGSIIYQGDDPTHSYLYDRVTFTVIYAGDSTVIKVTPKTGFQWVSETWYSIELEQGLHTVDNLDLAGVDNSYWDDCTEENYWGYFKSEDSRNPVCIFYEDEPSLFFNDGLGTGDPLLDLNLTVEENSNILVSIDEWTQLGFDGFRNLEPSAQVNDANALRRYFALYRVNGTTLTPISFDVKDFTLDSALDMAEFYIDPYYATGDDPNFVKGSNYKVCFIDNPNEFTAAYIADPALVDDNGNPVGLVCANFTCPADPIVPTCLVSATLNGVALNKETISGLPVTNIPVTSDSILTMVLCFDVPVDQPTGGFVSLMSGLTTVQTANLPMGTRSGDYKCITYTFDMHSTSVLGGTWTDNSVYSIEFSSDSLISNSIEGCYFPSDIDPFNDIHTIDGSAPVITGFIPDLVGLASGPCLFDKNSTDIIINWDEAVNEQTGKKLEIWRASTNTLIASIDASFDTTKAGDNYMRIPNSLFANLLEYNQMYYIHISSGFVKNLVGLSNAQITTNDTLRFCVGPDPAPAYVSCNIGNGAFDPKNMDYTEDSTPLLTITFTEPVVPVAGTGKDIQIYRSGVINHVNDSYLHAPVTQFTPVAGSNNTKWRLNTATAFAIAGVHSEFAWGECYDVNIPRGAFKEAAGSQVVDTLITNTINGYYNQSACPWTFCINDVTPPSLTFWPAKSTTIKEHIATNSYLYVYINELPVLANGDPLNVTNAENYFTFTRGASNQVIPFDVEFVGNDIPGGDNAKQRIRIVPRDTQGPDWSLTSNTPAMMPDSIYTLSFVNDAPLMQDVNDNAIIDNFTQFRVEDIVCPIFDLSPDASIVKATADSIYVTSSINEGGLVRWVALKNGKTITPAKVWANDFSSSDVIAHGEVATTAINPNPNFNVNFNFKFDATEATGYDFDVYMFASDDEVDLFDTDAEILAEWPYSDPTMGFEDEVYRIKDLRPAPNRCGGASEKLDVQFCDNDKPILVKTYPLHMSNNFPVGDSILLIFNEYVQINDDQETGTQIVLRDAHNNLSVPIAYKYFGAKHDTIAIYPLDSAAYSDQARWMRNWHPTLQFKELEDERDYYLEIDRWAISDENGCVKGNNPFGEWVGKNNLQFRTEDNTCPTLVDWMPKVCVEPEADITLTFNELNLMAINPAINPDSAYIYIYKVGSITPHERIPVRNITPVNGGSSHPTYWTYTFPTAYKYLSDTDYRVRVPNSLFIDNSGNSCNNGFSWIFHVRDYEDPIASWTIIQDYTYLDIAYDDDEYEGLIVKGAAGATINNIPTSSLLKIEFNEDVYVWDNESGATNKWTVLGPGASVRDELAAAITLKDVTNNVTLTYDPDGYGIAPVVGNWDFQEIGSNYAIIRVYQAQDHWMPDFAINESGRKDRGFKSNTTYTAAVAAAVFSDDEDCDNSRNIYDGNNPLVTIITRDDTPPTLTITDANEVPVCGARCVSANNPIHLKFNTKVVKTPWVGIDYDATLEYDAWSEFVNWWSNANLPLLESDLKLTKSGDFLYFYKGSNPSDSVKISSVTVDPNGMDIYLYLASPLASQAYYTIGFKGGSVKDQKRIPDGNEFIGMSCTFRVKDNIAPEAVSFFPADNAADISNILGTSTLGSATFGPDSMAIMFSEVVKKGVTTDKLVVRRLNGQIFDEVSISECTIDAQDKRVLVVPVNALEEFKGYYVEVPAGFVLDTTFCTPNGSKAIDPEIIFSPTNRFQWNFSTADATPPTPIVYIPNDTDTVPRNSNLTIIFDENIYVDSTCLNSGVYIYHHDNTVGWVGNPGVDFGNIVEFIPFYLPATPKNFANFSLEGTDVYNGKTQDKIIFNPQNDFTRVGTYYVRVSGSCIRDGQYNRWAGLGDSTTWRFKVTNDVAPVLASTDPVYNHTTNPWSYVKLAANEHGYVTANLSMFFVDEMYHQPLFVAPGTGKIKIMEYRYNPLTFSMEEKLWKEISITDPSVTFNAQTGRVDIAGVILRDNINRKVGAYEECYYILAESGTVTNGYPGSMTFWAGINNAFVWRFQTGNDDTFLGPVDIISPNIAEHGVDAQNLTIPAASSLVAEFGENIEALTAPTGKVQVFKVGVSTPVEEVTVTNLPGMIVGKRLTVGLTKLVDETNYYVQLQAGSFGDTSTVSTPNFAFGGVGVWEFQTGDNTAPVAVTKEPSTTCVKASTTLTMTFNESRGVTKGTGNLVVTNPQGTVIDQVAAADIVISANGNTVTAIVDGLPDTTLLTVTVPANFIYDGDTHSPLPNAAFSWTFTTGENSAPIAVVTPTQVGTPSTVVTITFNEKVVAKAGKKVTIGGKAVDVAQFATVDSLKYTFTKDSLASETTYSVVVEAGAFEDLAACVPNAVAQTLGSFVVGDIIAPLASGSPTSASDYKGLVLKINFTDAVTPATGNVVVYNAATDVAIETIPSSAFTAAAGNMEYTYAPKKILFGHYYILIDAGAFVDNSAAPIAKACPGISSKTAWPLAIVDPSFVNCYHIIAPLRATQNVPLTTTVVIDFCDERIAAGVGAVTIGDQSVNRVLGVNYFEYPVTASMISGNKLSIPVTGLKENTTYSIIIPQGAITDEAGNPFIGITDANLWIFTTGDFTNPVVTVPAVTVMNDGTAAPVAITSSEAGTVYLAKDDVAANAASLLEAIAIDKAVAATVTTGGVAVNVSVEGLVPGTYKAYGFDAAGKMGTAVNVVNVITIVLPEYRTIKQIQGEAAASPFAGQKVRTSGVVTAKLSNGFYMQDANAAWSGIFVSSTENVVVGSGVEVIGIVAEVDGLTTIGTIESLTFVAPIITPVAVQIGSTVAIAELYEGVLVEVTGRATAGAVVTTDWNIVSAGNVTTKINNAIYGSYTTLKEYNYVVTGIGIPAATAYKVLAIEIVNKSIIDGKLDLSNAVKVYPNPFDKYITLEVSNDVVITKAVITNIAGQLVKEVINPSNTISTIEMRSGVYFISLHTADGRSIKTDRIIKR
jgi:hypothetical protein